MGIYIIDGAAGTNKMGVDSFGSAKVGLYDPAGNAALVTNASTLNPATQTSQLMGGVDHRVARNLRASSDGALRVTSDTTLMLYDEAEGAAVNTNTWVQTLTTMTVTQASGVITLNAGSSVATTVGAMHVSHRQIPYIKKSGLLFRMRCKPTAHFANNQIQLGFGAPTAVTAVATPNGAFWRKDGTGQWVPVFSIGGAEQLGTPISNATFIASVPPTAYCIFEILLEQTRAIFRILLSSGQTVNEQTIDIVATSTIPQVTHFNAFYHIVNTGATGTAVQLLVDGLSVWATDAYPGRSWRDAMAGMGFNLVTSPTAYTQLANYANSAAPASATLSNTAAGYTTLGGQWQFAAVAGAETDYALFGIANPSPYNMYVTGVQIAAFNTVVAVATTATVLQWGLAVNSSAVSLATAAPYTAMRVTLGVQSFPVAAAVGANQPDIIRTFQTPLVVFPGRFIHVILKMPIATATATEVFRGTVSFDGYFE